MRSSEIGGQAVIEGVMMKNKNKYAVAVRKPDKEIAVDVKTSGSKEHSKLLKLPIIRGVVAFIDSMVVGIQTLSFSASFFEDEEEEKKAEKKKSDKNKKNSKKSVKKEKTPEQKKKAEEFQDKAMIAGTIAFSVIISVAFFMLLPMFLSRVLTKVIDSQAILLTIEAVLRIGLFIGYVVAISQVEDIKRVFRYHGAEHKTINCIENGYELTVENAMKQTRFHKRCGTSFMFFVIFLSIIFFAFIRADQVWLQALIRILLVPVIAGVAYEFIRYAGNHDSALVRIFSVPGFWIQGLTTKEPDESMIEVAIASVEAVFDWRKYLEEQKDEKPKHADDIVEEIFAEDTIESAAETKLAADNAEEADTDLNSELRKNDEAEIISSFESKEAEDNLAANEVQTEESLTEEDLITEDILIEEDFMSDYENAPVHEKFMDPEEELSGLDKVLSTGKMAEGYVEHPTKGKSEVTLKQEQFEVPEQEEEDEILRALDKFFVFDEKDAK